MGREHQRIETLCIHSGEPRPRLGGAVSMPVFQSSTFEYTGEESYGALRYIRMNNTPNHEALHAKLAALEGAEAALVTASGMAAISTTLLALLSPGDHVLAQNRLYGGTHALLFGELARLGVACDLIDADRPETWTSKLRGATRLVYAESITNPLLSVGDLPGIASFAKAHGLISIIDNTFPTPLLFRPIETGFDLSLHSCTKYLNGHSDIVAGAVIGRGDLVGQVLHTLNHLGGSLDPHACFLLHRGLKTLAVRVREQCKNAQALAEFLERRPEVLHVNYPGLPSHPSHARARALFSGYGGMVSFELDGDEKRADRFLAALRLPVTAPGLGGVETLVTRPATTSHAAMSREARLAAGITDTLIRVSVGIEAHEDLCADFAQALSN
jgi:cystathionine beta-lyase/cystathionine gamma-synthase